MRAVSPRARPIRRIWVRADVLRLSPATGAHRVRSLAQDPRGVEDLPRASVQPAVAHRIHHLLCQVLSGAAIGAAWDLDEGATGWHTARCRARARARAPCAGATTFNPAGFSPAMLAWSRSKAITTTCCTSSSSSTRPLQVLVALAHNTGSGPIVPGAVPATPCWPNSSPWPLAASLGGRDSPRRRPVGTWRARHGPSARPRSRAPGRSAAEPLSGQADSLPLGANRRRAEHAGAHLLPPLFAFMGDTLEGAGG